MSIHANNAFEVKLEYELVRELNGPPRPKELAIDPELVYRLHETKGVSRGRVS
jgi:hypothetical protein